LPAGRTTKKPFRKEARLPGGAGWSRLDADRCNPVDLADFLGDFAGTDFDALGWKNVRIFVIDREGNSSDDFRDHRPLQGLRNEGIITEILEYFAETRMSDFTDFARRVFSEGYERLEEQLIRFLAFQTVFSLKSDFGDWLAEFLEDEGYRFAFDAESMEEERDYTNMGNAKQDAARYRFFKSLLDARIRAEEKGVFPGGPEKPEEAA